MTDEARIVRSDRVGLYTQGLVSTIPLPLNASIFGNLWLTSAGDVGFGKVSWYDSDWRTSVAQVTEARTVGWREAMSCYQGVTPSRLLHAKFQGKSYLVLFTGIVHFMSGTEKAIGHIPGVHHVGALAVATKSSFDNRGAKGRAVAARDVWLRVLTKNEVPSNLPTLTDQSVA